MSFNMTRRWSRTPAFSPAPVSGAPSTAPEPPAAGWSRSKQPSLRQLARIDSFAAANRSFSSRRPHTTAAGSDSASLLKKPHQHWHLNTTALHILSRPQTARLYALFRFYDSSARGDALPSINCTRFLEILRDADLLGGDLTIAMVEKFFAQAVLGSLRAYLDADGRPALPFPAFCGTLLHLSSIKFPAVTPDESLKITLARLDSILDHPGSTSTTSSELPRVGSSSTLLRHFPSEGQLSIWESLSSLPLGRSNSRLCTSDEKEDFRVVSAFPEVIADLTCDLAEQKRLDERNARAYLVSPELASQFPPGVVQIVINKFQTFDILDRGALPRVEMFALLSALAKPLELADIHSTLAILLKGITGGEDVTLMHLLETLSAIRASRRSSQGSFNVASNRKASVETETVEVAAVSIETGLDDDVHASDRAGRTAGKQKHKSHGSHTHHSHQQHQPTHPTNTQHAGRHGSTTSTSSRHRKNLGGNSPGKQNRKVDEVSHNKKQRPKEAMTASNNDGHDVEAPRLPIPDDTSSYTATSSSARGIGSTSGRSNDNDSAQSDCMHRQPPPTNTSADLKSLVLTKNMLEVVLLLGGDHDGAVASVLSLDLRSHQFLERCGTLLGGNRVVDSVETPVLPIQQTLTAALLVMKKRLSARLSEGFIPHSQPQVDQIDMLLTAQQLKQPHYRMPIGMSAPKLDVTPIITPSKSQVRSPIKPITTASTKVIRPLSPEQQRNINYQCAQQRESTNNWVRELNEAVVNDRKSLH